jgi:hypothetical protein
MSSRTLPGPVVEAAHVAARRQIGDVGDAADVGNHAMKVARSEHRGVERGHERRPLPASGDIARAQVSDHRDVRVLRNPCRVVDLHGPPFVRPMAHGLPMHARGDHVVRLDSAA